MDGNTMGNPLLMIKELFNSITSEKNSEQNHTNQMRKKRSTLIKMGNTEMVILNGDVLNTSYY